MSSTFYLPRTLRVDDKTYSEAALVAASRLIIVLAEPGAGKTRLMESLAHRLGTSAVTANRFVHTGTKRDGSPLLIDAYDELAKVDASGIHKLLALAHDAAPSSLLISSRSSEWDNAATNALSEYFGEPALIARLLDFSEDEQKEIFGQHAPIEDFDLFRSEVSRFDLEALLPNPQFLILFIDAYLQSGRCFKDKRSIFAQAVERLAKEANSNIKTVGRSLSPAQKVEATSEVFAKLLLSGSEGVTTSEAREEKLYPLLGSLVNEDNTVNVILATRLFKPGDAVDTHRPVHKIVAEYTAADYLTKRIADPTDSLTLEKCLPVIAPNSVVRDELRGLLGWIASLGNERIQKAAIKLDSYAVLANGDPSQLEPGSKQLLLRSLKKIEENDPYFRRGDFWRRFSVAGFFTPAVISEIRPLLKKRSDGHLRDLVLDLLAGSPAITYLTNELRSIALSPQEGEYTRVMAIDCLLDRDDDYHHYHDLAILIFQASQASLRVAAQIIEKRGTENSNKQCLIDFFYACSHLYPTHRDFLEVTIGSRYFIKHLAKKLGLVTTEYLLNELTKDLSCDCGKKSYECECRNGISKVVGLLLDNYFALASGPYDPIQIWGWVQNLNFEQNKGPDESKSVEVLRADNTLRENIIKHVFGSLSSKEEIFKTKMERFDWHSHSGLIFRQEDHQFVVDLAFKTGNLTLWSAFIARHQYHRPPADRGPDALRRHMRKQALLKADFMGEWTRINRDDARSQGRHRSFSLRHSRRMKRRRRQQNEIRAANIDHANKNRDLIESGRHWGYLFQFAKLSLMQPDRICEEFGDEMIARNALYNCFKSIAPQVPDLVKLAELQCVSKGHQSQTILYAACLEVLRRDGNLNQVPVDLLWALKTNIDMHYSAVQENEREAINTEVNRLALHTDKAVIHFCRQYIEPQLLDPNCNHTKVHWLHHDPAFESLASYLSFEWLSSFKLMSISALNTLFDIAAKQEERERLKNIIKDRSEEVLQLQLPGLSQEQLEERRTFWFIRAFYFLDKPNPLYWDWLKSDKEHILIFNEISGRMNRGDHPNWPQLTSRKVEAILNGFFNQWPKVPLPNSWGTGSPKGETAYRFLTEVIWSINSDNPDEAIPTLRRLLGSSDYSDLKKEMKSMLAGLERKQALRDFEPPSAYEITSMLDCDTVATVEGMRQLVIDELSKLQSDIDGGEFNTADRFYAGGKRLDEAACTRIIAERLHLLFQHKNITVTPEHHLKHDKRCDFTIAKVLSGQRRLLVTEVKGQWHPRLYEAASNQLNDLYAIHTDAERQGVYLVLWYGKGEKVAGKIRHEIRDAKELKTKIESALPTEIRGLIDVFVLDFSSTPNKPANLTQKNLQ